MIFNNTFDLLFSFNFLVLEIEVSEVVFDYFLFIVMKLVLKKMIKMRMGSDICLHELKKVVIGYVLFVIYAIHNVTRHIKLVICDFYANWYVT